MAFEFAYSLDGGAVSTIKDFPLDTVGVSSSGYNVGIANTIKPRKGDCVFINAGKLRKQYDVVTPKAVGVVEGFEFLGLADVGSTYAATNSSFTFGGIDTVKYPNGVAKVRIETDSVYRVSPKSGQTVTAGLIGNSYNIFVDTANNNDQSIDITLSTNSVVKVVDVDIAKNKLYVIMATNNTF
jgi:hypothetical protein